MSTSTSQLKYSVYTALFVALISLGAFIAIPIGPVPIVLQNMFVLLAAVILGPGWGLACIGIYLLIGFAGLPVFAGGTSGIGKIFGPTGGYLIGYIPCVLVTGMISKSFGRSILPGIIAMTVGSCFVYAAGVPWLKAVTGMSFSKAFAVGMYPFLIGDIIKIIAAALIVKSLKQVIRL